MRRLFVAAVGAPPSCFFAGARPPQSAMSATASMRRRGRTPSAATWPSARRASRRWAPGSPRPPRWLRHAAGLGPRVAHGRRRPWSGTRGSAAESRAGTGARATTGRRRRLLDDRAGRPAAGEVWAYPDDGHRAFARGGESWAAGGSYSAHAVPGPGGRLRHARWSRGAAPVPARLCAGTATPTRFTPGPGGRRHARHHVEPRRPDHDRRRSTAPTAAGSVRLLLGRGSSSSVRPGRRDVGRRRRRPR